MISKRPFSSLSNVEHKVLHILKKDKNTIILSIAKRRMSVTLDGPDYTEKVKQITNDNACRLLNSDPTAKLKNKINKTVKKLQDKQRINYRRILENEDWNLKCSTVLQTTKR